MVMWVQADREVNEGERTFRAVERSLALSDGSATLLLAHLWMEGFKVVALEDCDGPLRRVLDA